MRELKILQEILEMNNLNDKLSIYDFNDSLVVLEESHRNWIVYSKKGNKQINKNIHLKLEDACVDILSRIDISLVDNFKSLCQNIRR